MAEFNSEYVPINNNIEHIQNPIQSGVNSPDIQNINGGTKFQNRGEVDILNDKPSHILQQTTPEKAFDRKYYAFENLEEKNQPKYDFSMTSPSQQEHKIHFDTRDRNKAIYPTATDMTFSLPRTLRNVTNITFNGTFESYIQEFTEENENLEIVIQEEDRFDSSGNLKEFVIRIDRGGYASKGKLRTELNDKANIEPDFLHYPNGFSDFVNSFIASGNFLLNFNDFQGFKYDTKIQKYVNRRLSNTVLKEEDDIVEDNNRILAEADIYFNTAYRNTIGYSSFSLQDAKVAYYYPPLKKKTAEDPSFLPESIVISGTTYTRDELERRILLDFQGLDDPVIINLIDIYITELDAYRVENTYLENPVNKYSFSIDEKNNVFQVAATQISEVIQRDINAKIDQFTSNSASNITDKNSIILQTKIKNSQQIEFYDIFQQTNASNLGVDYGSITISGFLNSNTTLDIRLVTNSNYDSILKGLTNDILETEETSNTSSLLDDFHDYPSIQSSNSFPSSFTNSNITIPSPAFSSNLDSNTFVNINSNVSIAKIESRIETGGYNIFEFTPQSNITGAFYLTPKYLVNQSNHLVNYDVVDNPAQLTDTTSLIVQSNSLTTEALLIQDISAQTAVDLENILTSPAISNYPVAKQQKVRFKFVPSETAIYNIDAHPFSNITGTQLRPVIHLYTDKGSFFGDQQIHYFDNENINYYARTSENFITPELYTDSNSTGLPFARIQETLEANHAYYFTIRAQDTDTFNVSGAKVVVYKPEDVSSSFTDYVDISVREAVIAPVLGDVATSNFNPEGTIFDFINSNQFDASGISLEYDGDVKSSLSPFFLYTKVDSSDGYISYSNISLPDDEYYISQHISTKFGSGISNELININDVCIISQSNDKILINTDVSSYEVDIPSENMNPAFLTTLGTTYKDINLVFHFTKIDVSNTTIDVYSREDYEANINSYSVIGGSVDISNNGRLFDISGTVNITLVNESEAKLGAFVAGEDDFDAIKDDYVAYIYRNNDIFDFTNPPAVTMINTIEDNLFAGSLFQPLSSNITSYIDASQSDVINGYLSIPYLTNISGGFSYSVNSPERFAFDNGIIMNGSHYFIIPNNNDTQHDMPSYKNDLSDISPNVYTPSTLFSFFGKPETGYLLGTTNENTDTSQNIYIEISGGVLEAGFGDGSVFSISGDIQTYIDSGNPYTINFLMNAIAVDDLEMGLYVNTSNLVSSNIDPAIIGADVSSFLSSNSFIVGNYQGKDSSGHILEGELYRYSLYRRNNADIPANLVEFLHSVNTGEPGFKSQYSSQIDRYLIADYRFYQPEQTDNVNLFIPNLMTKHISPSEETNDIIFNSGSLSNLPFYNSLQFYHYSDPSGYISFDSSGIYFNQAHANERSGNLEELLFIGNFNIDLSGEEFTVTNSIQPINEDFSIFLDVYPEDMSGPYTLLQFNTNDTNRENPRLYLEDSVLYFASEEATGDDIKALPLDDTSVQNKRVRVILAYQAKTELLIGEIDRGQDESPFEFRINSRDYGYDSVVLGCDLSGEDVFVGHFRTYRKFDTFFDQAARHQLFEREDPTTTSIAKNFSYEPDLTQYQSTHIDFTNSGDIISFKPGISDISHYIFTNQEDISAYNYTSHTHTGFTYYSIDLTDNNSASFGFETIFKASGEDFILYQSSDIILFVNNNQIRIYTTTNGLEATTINIINNVLTILQFSYSVNTQTIRLLVNNEIVEISGIVLGLPSAVNYYGGHQNTELLREVTETYFDNRIYNTYYNGDVYFFRFYNRAIGNDPSQTRQRLLNFADDLKENFLELTDTSGVVAFEFTDTNIFQITHDGDFVAVYTDIDTLKRDLADYPDVDDYKSSHRAFVYQDQTTSRTLPIRSGARYYLYAGQDEQNISIALLNSYDKVAGRRNVNYTSVYELEDLNYLDQGRLVPKTQTRLYNNQVIPNITPELVVNLVNDISGYDNYDPFAVTLTDTSIKYQVLDGRNQPIYFNQSQNELTYSQGKALLHADTGQPVLYIYDSYSDLETDLSGTNNFTNISVPGLNYKWGGETSANIFQQDVSKNSSIKYYDSVGQQNLVQLIKDRSYYFVVRGKVPTQEFSYYLNISGDAQKIDFRQLTIEELLADISNSVSITADKLYNFTNIPTLFNGYQIAPSLIPYGDVQDNDRNIYPMYSLHPIVLTDDDTTNILKPKLIEIYNTFSDDATAKAQFATYITTLNNASLQNYMVLFINDFTTAFGLTASQIADPAETASLEITKVSTSFLSTYVGKLFNDFLLFSITLNNNQYIHHVLLRSMEDFFETINVQYNDIVYDASTDITGFDADDIYAAATRLAAKFMAGVDNSGSFIHSNYSTPINRIDGIPGEASYENSIYGNMVRNTYVITDGDIITHTETFLDDLVTDASNNHIYIRDLSDINTSVNTYMSNLGFSSYTADPSDNYYERKKEAFIHVFLKEIGISEVDINEYDEEYRASLVGCDTTFWDLTRDSDASGYPARIIELDDGFNYITNYEQLDVVAEGYNDAYLDLKDINDDYNQLLAQFNGDGLNDDVREQLRAYIQSQYAGILPSSFADRERFYEPLRFKILFRSALSDKPEQLARKFNWGLGYYLGYDKQDTDFDVLHKATSVPRPIGDGYIYMIMNEFNNKELNIYSLVEHRANANRYEFLTPANVIVGGVTISGDVTIEDNYAPCRTTVENTNTAEPLDTTYRGTNKYFTEIAYSGPFNPARISESRSLDNPLSKLEQIQIRFIDRYGNAVTSDNIDYRGTITIRTDNKN
jgi:hypothetical protein